MNARHPARLTPVLALLLLPLAIACADPAADAPQAAVEEPAPATDPAPTAEGTEYTLADGSSISFVGSKVTGTHEGGFEAFTGTVRVVDGDPTMSSVEVNIDATSLWSDDDRLTGHLKSEDFFEVETYPTASFTSTAIAANDEGGYTMTGNLDLHGVTKQISFPASIEMGDGEVRASAEFAIKRFDFDIVYPGRAEDLIRDDVLVKLDLVATPAG